MELMWNSLKIDNAVPSIYLGDGKSMLSISLRTCIDLINAKRKFFEVFELVREILIAGIPNGISGIARLRIFLFNFLIFS